MAKKYLRGQQVRICSAPTWDAKLFALETNCQLALSTNMADNSTKDDDEDWEAQDVMSRSWAVTGDMKAQGNLRGSTLRISQGGTEFALATSCKINASTSTDDATTKDDAEGWDSPSEGSKSMTITVDRLYAPTGLVLDADIAAFIADTNVTLSFGVGGYTFSGTFAASQFTNGAQNKKNVTGSWQFTLVGALTSTADEDAPADGTNISTALNSWITGGEINMYYIIRSSTGTTSYSHYGKALMTGVDIDATVSQNVTASVSLTGVGALS